MNKLQKVRGWIKFIRPLSKIIFINLINHVEQYVLREDLKDKYTLKYDDYIEIEFENDGRDNVVKHIDILSKNKNNIQYSKLSWSDSNKDLFRVPFLRLGGNKTVQEFSKIIKLMREYFEFKGSMEIFTPSFCRGTKEGARSFNIPSRLHPGKYYSLAQSPQIFKQLLISSGFDRYYQVCSVFRDEDTRQDRLYGEFKQLDFEAANVEIEDLKIILQEMVEKIHNYMQKPYNFNVDTYSNIMECYGTDKPDLRIKYKWQDNKIPLNNESEFLLNKFQNQVKKEGDYIILIDETYKYKILENLPKNDVDCYLFLCDFPFYELCGAEYKIGHNPFTAIYKFEEEKTIGKQFDLVYNGYEICSGGIRNNDEETFRQCLNFVNITNEYIDDNYGKLIDSWNGIPPHGGFAIGLERYISTLLNVGIRDVVAFPYTTSGKETMTNSPNEIEENT